VLSLSSALAAELPTIEPGKVIQISTATFPDLKGSRTAIGGGPALVAMEKSSTPMARRNATPEARLATTRIICFWPKWTDGRTTFRWDDGG